MYEGVSKSIQKGEASMRKKVSLVLATCMALSLTACSSGSEPTATTAAQKAAATEAAKQEAATQTAAAEKAEPIKVTIFNNSGGGTGAGSEAGSTEESYEAVQDYILEQTGVLVEVIKPPATEASNKLAAMLASGEEIDLWWGNWSDYSADGIIQPLNDALDAWGQDVVDVYNQWDAWGRVTAPDGTIWGIPRYTSFASYYTHVREDWLELLDMEVPKTFEEFEKYLYAVKELDPAGNGQTIPFIFRGGSVDKSLEWALLGGFTDAGRSQWVDENGNVMPKELQEGYTDFLAVLAKWYKDGIINKEAFSWDTATIREYIGSGRVAAACTYYTDISQFTPIMQQTYPEANFVHYVPGMTGPNGQLCQTLNPGSSKQMLISSKCTGEKLEALMKVINWSFASWDNYQVCTWGLEGVHWEYDTSVVDLETAKRDHVTKNIEGSGYWSDFCLSIGLPYESQGIIYNADGRQNMHSLYLSTYLDDFDTCKPTIDRNITFNSQELTDNIPSLSDINTTIKEETLKFVTGERDLSTYDAFVEELYAIGLDDWIAEYTRQYNELTGK